MITMLHALESKVEICEGDKLHAAGEQALTQLADHILLTIHLKHQTDKPLAEINAWLDAACFWKHFPNRVEVIRGT